MASVDDVLQSVQGLRDDLNEHRGEFREHRGEFLASERTRVDAQREHRQWRGEMDTWRGKVDTRLERLDGDAARRPAHDSASAVVDDLADAREYRALRRAAGRFAKSWVTWVVTGIVAAAGIASATVRSCGSISVPVVPAVAATAGAGR